jgi:hypothetical protein
VSPGSASFKPVPGAIAILVVLVLLPVLVCLGSALIAVALGWSLNRDGEARHEGSELLDTV